MASPLTTKLDRIIDKIDPDYHPSQDYNDLREILDEVWFLYSRNILNERGLGRFHDIVKDHHDFHLT